MCGEQVEVVNKDGTEHMSVYKDLLTHYSAFFRTRLGKDWDASNEGVVVLTQEEYKWFQIVAT